MRALTVETSVELDAPSNVVWRVLTDWERQGDWMLEASDFLVVSPHREGVGVEAEATVKIGGISTRDKIRVDAWEPRRHLGIEHLGWVGGRGDLWLSDRPGDRTLLAWQETLSPPLGVFGYVGMWLFRPLLARTFRRDAAVLARLVGEAAQGRYPMDDR